MDTWYKYKYFYKYNYKYFFINIRITKLLFQLWRDNHASLIVVGTLDIFNYALNNMSFQMGFYCVIGY